MDIFGTFSLTPRLPEAKATKVIVPKGKQKMKKLIIAAAIATLMGGCYIGKAAFQGEDMKIYPFFGPTAGTTGEG